MIPSGTHEPLTAPQDADIVSESFAGPSEPERGTRSLRSPEEATSRLTARGVRVPGICAHLRVAAGPGQPKSQAGPAAA